MAIPAIITLDSIFGPIAELRGAVGAAYAFKIVTDSKRNSVGSVIRDCPHATTPTAPLEGSDYSGGQLGGDISAGLGLIHGEVVDS